MEKAARKKLSNCSIPRVQPLAPRAVMLTNANFVYGSEVFRAATGLRNDDRHLISLPLYHSAAQCHALWPSVIAGCSVSLLSRFSASRFFEQAATHDATMAALFGAPLRMLLNQPRRPTDRAHRLRNVTYAQNLTPAQYEDWDRRFGAPLQQLWGMTEICALPIMSPLSGGTSSDGDGPPGSWLRSKDRRRIGRSTSAARRGAIDCEGYTGTLAHEGILKRRCGDRSDAPADGRQPPGCSAATPQCMTKMLSFIF